ncbi:MAG: P-loop NTPase [Gemmatimonadota bacterium]
MARRFRTYGEVDGSAGQEVLDQVVAQRRRLDERLSHVRWVVPVVSGKGGVGKSAITANLATLLARRGRRVGVVDADLNGPSLARMLGTLETPLMVGEDGIVPAIGAAGVRLVSMDLLLSAADAPLRWKGPANDSFLWRGALETSTLREFLADIAWGSLDYLFVDVPPGTDRIERVLELVPAPGAVLLVTTPSAAAMHVVAKSARLLREAGVGQMGLVTNMSSYLCPCCGCAAELFQPRSRAGVQDIPGVEPWAEIPFDPALGDATDGGRPPVLDTPDSPAVQAFERLASRLEERLGR